MQSATAVSWLLEKNTSRKTCKTRRQLQLNTATEAAERVLRAFLWEEHFKMPILFLFATRPKKFSAVGFSVDPNNKREELSVLAMLQDKNACCNSMADCLGTRMHAATAWQTVWGQECMLQQHGRLSGDKNA